MRREGDVLGRTPDTAAGVSPAPAADVPALMDKLFAPRGEVLNMDAAAVGTQLLGPSEQDAPVCSTFAEARRAIAPGFGCDPSELVVTHSTTDALSRIIAGLELREGDEVLTTNHEHYGSLAPLALARDRRGVVIKKVNLPVGNDHCAEDYPALFAPAFTNRTKVLLFSAPTATVGTMLPVEALTRLAQSNGCVSVVDGAHMPGMLHRKFEELGADFLAGSGTKWQCGPPGTGLLYVRNRVLPRFNPQPLPPFWPVISIWYPLEGGLPPRTTDSSPTYDIAEYLQTCGSASLLRIKGFQRACETWDFVGRERIERYLLELSSYLKERVAETWGDETLYSPRYDPRLLSAISAFNPFVGTPGEHDESRFRTLIERLEAEQRIVVRYTRFVESDRAKPRFAIRVAVRPFHRPADVERLLSSMTMVCATMN